MSSQGELRYAVRWRVVAKYGGQLCLVLAALNAVPFAASLLWRDFDAGLRYLLVSVVLGGLGTLGSRLVAPRSVQANETLVIAGGMFVLTSLVMAAPLADAGLDAVDAWFESVSAVTTTGLSVTDTVEGKPPVFLLNRAFMQWYGGLGFVVLSLGLALPPSTVARRLALAQSEEEDIVTSTRAHARRVLLIYCSLTGLGVAALWLSGTGGLDALLHTLAAVSTGGFSSRDSSLAGFSSVSQLVTILLAFSCAVPLSSYWLSDKERWHHLAGDRQLWALLLFGLLTCLLLFGILLTGGALPWPEALRQALLNGLSAQSTTGFSTTDVARLDPGAKLVLIGSMIVGGGSGSTAGGVKLLRVLILLRVAQVVLLRTMLPKHATFFPRLAGRRLDEGEREIALCVVTLFALSVFVSWLPFVVSGYDPLDSLFEVVSALATVGLSTGIARPELPDLLKAVLCIDMLLGRLEILALLVLLYPGTWIGRRMQSS